MIATNPTVPEPQLLAEFIVGRRGEPSTWRKCPQHEGLALAVIDAVMSPRIHTNTVAAVTARYAERFGCDDDVAALKHSFHQLTPEQWRHEIATNHRTSTRPGAPYKADAIRAAADLFIEQGIETRAQLHARAEDLALRAAWCALPGQGSGGTWRHLLLTSGFNRPLVCPLTRRTLRAALGQCPAENESALAVMTAAARIVGVSLHDVDHQMWRAALTPARRDSEIIEHSTTFEQENSDDYEERRAPCLPLQLTP